MTEIQKGKEGIEQAKPLQACLNKWLWFKKRRKAAKGRQDKE